MPDKHLYSIIKDLGLIVEYFEGPFNYKILKQTKDQIQQNKDFKPGLNVIADLRRTEMCPYCDTEIKALAKFVEKIIDNLHKVALLTDTPDQTVGAQLFEKELSNEVYNQFSIFTTLDSCIKYVGIDLKHFNEIKSEIEKLSGREEPDLL